MNRFNQLILLDLAGLSHCGYRIPQKNVNKGIGHSVSQRLKVEVLLLAFASLSELH